MRRTLEKLERLTDSVSLFSANIAAMILLLLVGITCVDVIGRYFFTPPRPLVGAVELVEICMGAITFFSFPLMFSRHDHIVVDLINIPRYPVVGFITAMIFTAAAITILKLLNVLINPGHSVENVIEKNLGIVAEHSKAERQDAS